MKFNEFYLFIFMYSAVILQVDKDRIGLDTGCGIMININERYNKV